VKVYVLKSPEELAAGWVKRLSMELGDTVQTTLDFFCASRLPGDQRRLLDRGNGETNGGLGKERAGRAGEAPDSPVEGA
jgi:hypothetical protein